jgi:hypothetical protein
MSERVPGTDPDHEQVADHAPEPTGDDALRRIAVRARLIARERLRQSLEGQATPAGAEHPADPAALRPAGPDDELLERVADEEAARADGALLRLSVVHAVSEELGIELEDALDHPAVAGAHELLRTPEPTHPDTDASDAEGPDADRQGSQRHFGTPLQQPALLLDAVHVFGIETLEPGDSDIELRLADVGIDVRKPSTGETIGRLRWDEVSTATVQRPRRGLGRRRPGLLVAGTDRGEVTFELPGVSEDEITEHLEPLILRNCEGFRPSDGG